MISPVALQVLGLQIKWYGIIMAIGFILGLFISIKLAKKRNISKETIEDLFIYLIPGSIIGARLAAVILDYNYYITKPLEIFAVWHGGMAFHGGLIGAVLASLYFCKKKNIKFYEIADIIVIPLALGLTLGRIGNFINQEFYGTLTNLPWGVYFDNVEGKRHPTQIYEAIKNLFIFIVLLFLYKFKKLKKGIIFWLFISLYSLLRFLIEFTKDQTRYYNLTYGQLISIPLFILSIFMIYKIGKKTNIPKDLKIQHQ
ncbi:prolipoprotein diacylglyceryl transferase [Candidatus Woesearchaeota archaeon]|nr:prolipoprotein diacylglyceryl transferase [Candidatus Woesearchaeota archaeon]